MTQNQVQHIIQQGESQATEFKTNFNKQTIETITAMANTKGGKVIIGISDKKEIVGVHLNSESIQNWQNEIKQKTEPAIFPDIDEVTLNEKKCIVISVPEFPVKPVAYQGRYYIRKNNSNHLLTIGEINDIYLQSTQTSWDSYPYLNSTWNDLDKSKIKDFIKKVNQSGRFKLNSTTQECLNKLRL